MKESDLEKLNRNTARLFFTPMKFAYAIWLFSWIWTNPENWKSLITIGVILIIITVILNLMYHNRVKQNELICKISKGE